MRRVRTSLGTCAVLVVALLLEGCGASDPHGTIAFSGVVRGASGIFLIDVDGTHLRRLATLGSQLAWTKDGGRLAFERDDGVWVVSRSAGRLQRVTRGPTSEFTWSPDGAQLAYRGDDFALYVVSTDGVVRKLTDDGRDPAWSPDGKWIAFLTVVAHANDYGTYDYVSIVRPDGTGRQRLQLEPGVAVGASWSPDSKRLVFAAPAAGVESYLYTIRRDGTDLRKLIPRPRFDLNHGTWSPDGKRIAFGDGQGTWVVDNAGRDLHRVSLLEGASWSPDSKWLAVHAARRLWVVSLDGTRQREVLVADAIGSAVWSPH